MDMHTANAWKPPGYPGTGYPGTPGTRTAYPGEDPRVPVVFGLVRGYAYSNTRRVPGFQSFSLSSLIRYPGTGTTLIGLRCVRVPGRVPRYPWYS
eukprot:751620-Rhodomonas_salina.1